jgi:hypothetical protein
MTLNFQKEIGSSDSGLVFCLSSFRVLSHNSSAEQSSFSLLPSVKKECFGEPLKPTREPRVLPRLSEFLFGVIRRVWRIIKILRLEHGNQMAQLIFDVAGCRNSIGNLLPQ